LKISNFGVRHIQLASLKPLVGSTATGEQELIKLLKKKKGTKDLKITCWWAARGAPATC
jgi:hypothetical protein